MFLQIIAGRVGHDDGIRRELERWHTQVRPGAPGWLATTMGTNDTAGLTALVQFTSEADARRNDEEPLSSQLDGGATVEESADVQPWLPLGWHEAGFVKVIRGRARDRAALAALMTRMPEIMRADRPEVIGDVFAWLAGDAFVDIAYFTSEQEARAGAANVPSPAGRQAMEEWQSLTHAVAVSELRDVEVRTA